MKCRFCGSQENVIKDGSYLVSGERRQMFTCRSCNTRRTSEYRATKSGKENKRRYKARYQREFPEKGRARWQTWYHLPNKPCSVCGEEPAHKHHPDYSKPLEVIYLCPAHHSELHKQIVNGSFLKRTAKLSGKQ